MRQRDLKYVNLYGSDLDGLARRAEEAHNPLSTPFPIWNAVCGGKGGRVGLGAGWTVILAGADGSGKTYLSLNIAVTAVREGWRVGYLNLEMSEEEIAARYLAIMAGEPVDELEPGPNHQPEVYARASHKVNEIRKVTGGRSVAVQYATTIKGIEEAYHRLCADEGVRLVVFDHAQASSTPGNAFQSAEEIAVLVHHLSHLYGVTTLLVAQYNREGKKAKRPSRHHLSGGGPWENYADQVVLIDHNRKELIDGDTKIRTGLWIDKNRHGRCPVQIPIRWDLKTMRWSEEPSPGQYSAPTPPKQHEGYDIEKTGIPF